MADNEAPSGTLIAEPPFSFGIGLQGELIIGFVGGYLPPDGQPLRLHLTIPAEELATLLSGLQQSQAIRDLLSVKAPTQSAH